MMEKHKFTLFKWSFITFLCLGMSVSGYAKPNKSEFSTAGFYKLPQQREVYNFNLAWRFYKGKLEGADKKAFNDDKWKLVHLPDGIEWLPVEASGCMNYQGEVWYRKHFDRPAETKGKRLMIYFEGIMGKSKVWVNGTLVKESFTGYFPLAIDVTDVVTDKDNVIAVWADNSNDPNYPPGKFQDVLDFTYFGGIYRDAWMYATNKVFITDQNETTRVAGGGVFVAYKNVSEQQADVVCKAEIKNLSLNAFGGKLIYELYDRDSLLVANGFSTLKIAKGKAFQTTDQVIRVKAPHLWEPAAPYLYHLIVKVVDANGQMVDGLRQRIGIRSIEFKGKDGLFLNGKHYDKPLIGANRHQDFAVIGHALPNSLHWRDAKKLKDVGMEIIRNAHYPQDPAFMDACDELGLFVIETTPGWQYWNENPTFEKGVYDNIRQMVRRDRNRPSVFLWEPILNETSYPDYFAKQVRDIVAQEYPYPSCYSACDYRSKGREFYSVWYENAINFNKEKPMNTDHSLDKITFFQREWGDCVDDWSSHNGPSRVSMKWGEMPMLTQAKHYAKTNFNYICYDAFFKTTPQFVGGCLWHPFDHQRGYHPDPFYGGIMDNFRQPKTSYHMFKSFRNPQIDSTVIAETGPYLYIANEMTPFSPEDVTVFSNCDKVVLTVNKNGKQLTYDRKPAGGMPYPLITFEKAFSYVEDKLMSDADNEKGVCTQEDSYLLAEGYLNGQKVAEQMRRPARRAERILLQVDESGKKLLADGSDKIVVIASIVDKNGQIKRLNNAFVRFTIEGEGRLVGGEKEHANPMEVTWGTAPIIVQSTTTPGQIKVYAEMDYAGSQRPISGVLEFSSVSSGEKFVCQDKEMQLTRSQVQTSEDNASKSTPQLQQQLDELRLELNRLKLKQVSSQQSAFDTAKEHK